jgi:hypothetical protein
MPEEKKEDIPICKELKAAGIDTSEKLRWLLDKYYDKEMATEDTMANAMKQLADSAKQAGQNILDSLRADAEKIAGKPSGKTLIPETTEFISSIKDSGDRTQFETGAVRDMREGKGRCDLMPLEVVGELMGDSIITRLKTFLSFKNTTYLYTILNDFAKFYDDGKTKTTPDEICNQRYCTMFLEVAKHFEEGAKKYGENNWQKGIPVKCYIDSAVRHYLKWLRGDKDEPHDRAFCWNLMCCIWEVDYSERSKPEAK